MRPLTCRLSFTTTGLAFSVNNFYHHFSSLSEFCTIHEFYRYTLMQFELRCSKVHKKNYYFYPHLDNSFSFDPKFEELLKEAEAHEKNFASIAHIINAYGYFETQKQTFCTILPPLSVHSPHTVRISNLRSVVTELAAGLNKEFVHQNTLPGAIYDAEGVLQNPDCIMPAVYDVDTYCNDASAVDLALNKLNAISDLASLEECVFSDFGCVGDIGTLVSTWINEASPCDRIPPSVTEGISDRAMLTSSSDCNWYTVHPLNDEILLRMNHGVLSYCGVWSKELAQEWPDVNVRYPGSSKALGTACWSTIFNMSMNRDFYLDYFCI